MSTTQILPLAEMGQGAKLRLMEELWDDLCHSSEGVTSAAWHGEVLTASKERGAKGEAGFNEWAEVKERLLWKKA